MQDLIPEVWVSWLAQEFIASIVNKDTDVFEWGCGGSTLWFAEHARSVVSVEHSTAWGERVAKELRDRQLQNCDLRVCRGTEQSARQVLGGEYGFVFVDGASAMRCECAKAGWERVIPGGWLAVDNTERPFAEPIHKMMRAHDSVTIRGNGPKHESGRYKITTTFWKKRRVIGGGEHDGH